MYVHVLRQCPDTVSVLTYIMCAFTHVIVAAALSRQSPETGRSLQALCDEKLRNQIQVVYRLTTG